MAGSGLVLLLAACTVQSEEETWLRFEAEAGIAYGTEKSSSGEGYSGEGYVTGFEQAEDALTLILKAPTKSLYEIQVGYRGRHGDKVTVMRLNDEPAGDLQLPASSGFEEVYAGKLLLDEGENELTFVSSWGWYDLDYVDIRPASAREPHRVENVLVTPEPSVEALALHQFLIEQYGNRILSGQQTLQDALQLGWTYGKLPAIAGFDLIDYTPSRTERGSTSREVEDMLTWHDKGGIVTLAWHWNAPMDLVDSESQPWWRGFYTEGTTFNLQEALADPDSQGYALLLRDIDVIAFQLKRLQEARIPVLWRPLHEAEGGWFWWGAQGPEPAKALYRILYDRLTVKHGLDNLIWIWNSEDADWFPGDDVVDIVSVDSYPEPGDHHPVSRSYDNLVRLVDDRKLVALTENGAIPDPERMIQYGAHWSWFCTWSAEFIEDGKHNSPEHIAAILDHEYVLTLDELPEFLKLPGSE